MTRITRMISVNCVTRLQILRFPQIPVTANLVHDLFEGKLLLEFLDRLIQVGNEGTQTFRSRGHFKQLLFRFGIDVENVN